MHDPYDPQAPFHVAYPETYAAGRWVICCDHATNRIPPEIGSLGLPDADMTRHIAYDIGALGVARALGRALAAPVVSSNFSRLVIDPNRGEDDPTLIMQLYDGSLIPGNRGLTEAGRSERITRYHRRYHAALRDVLAAVRDPILVSVHSFTPQLRGKAPRPWEVGILFAEDRRLADPLISELSRGSRAPVGANAPYGGDLPGDTVATHALQHGHLNALIELRQDLIGEEDGQRAWAATLARALQAALAQLEMPLQSG